MSYSSSQMPEQNPRTEVVTFPGSKSSLESLAQITGEKPPNLLTLPREVRDKVYAYLLSTEYNRHEYEKPWENTLRGHYTYRFHTSILCTNWQIYNEASQAFYMNNLLVCISCDGDFAKDMFLGFPNLVLVKDPKAESIKRHAMEINLLFEGEVSSNHTDHKFIVTCNELPALCRGLLYRDAYRDAYMKGTLASLKLRLVIGDEIGIDWGSARGGKATESHGDIQSRPTGKISSFEESHAGRNYKIGTTSSRVRRLLEPFRRLHSIRDPQIIAPLSKEYKAEVIADICRPLPSDHDLFDHVVTTFEEAVNTFDTGDFASSISELRNTLDELKDARYLHTGDAQAEIITGPYAGNTFWNAFEDIEFCVCTKLAWACLKTGDVNAADNWLTWIVQMFIDSQRKYGTALLEGHNVTMVYYLESQVLEERDCVGQTLCRSDCLQQVIRALQEGLRHQPGNGLLEQQLRRSEEGLKIAEEMTELIDTSDPIYE